MTRDRTATIGMVVVLFISLGVYFASETVLRKAMLKPIKREKVDFAKVLDWLPPKAKAELEYRARYLDFRQKFDQAKTNAEKLQTAYKLAVHTRDQSEHNELMLPFINDPQYLNLEDVYLAYGRMLYDPKNPKAITIQRYYDFINSISDPVQIYLAWREGRDRLGRIGLRDAHVVNVEFLKPLLDKPLEFFVIRDYNSMLDNIKRNAQRISNEASKRIANNRERPGDKETSGEMAAIANKADLLLTAVNKSSRNYPFNDYKKLLVLRDKMNAATAPKDKFAAAFELVRHTRDAKERADVIRSLLKNPEYVKDPGILRIYAQVAGDIGKKNALPIEDFQKIILTFSDPADQYHGFLEGLRRQNGLRSPSKQKMALLRPLLNKTVQEIPFKDYADIYDQLSNCAVFLNDQPAFEKSIQLRDALKDSAKPTVKEYLDAKQNKK